MVRGSDAAKAMPWQVSNALQMGGMKDFNVTVLDGSLDLITSVTDMYWKTCQQYLLEQAAKARR